MKEVCLDARMLGFFGIGTYLKQMIEHLKDAPIKLRLITHPQKQVEGVENIFCSAPIYSLSEQYKLPLIIPPCDLFWSPHFNVPIFQIKAKKRLVALHDVYHLVHSRFLKKMVAKALISRAVSRSEKIITFSHFSVDEMVKYGGAQREKIVRIPHGVDTAFFQQSAAPKENYLLFVGSSKPHKNLKGLIEAHRLLQKRGYENLELIIASQVSDEKLRELYQRARALVFPSFYEGFGLPPLEAMACGCPVVASNRASLPEVCGDAAILVDPSDPENIAAGIIEALDKSRELIQKGWAQARTFSWKESALKHLQLIEEL